MTAVAHALFDTEIGHCAIAWSDHGIVALQLPESTPEATLRRLDRRFPEAAEATPPPDVQATIDAVVALLAGDHVDLTSVDLDLDDEPEFHRRVYAEARTIPPGETRSYGQIAVALGEPGSAQAVGKALGSNPTAILVPCHRVVGAGGEIGGFSAHGGAATKRRILTIEGWHADQLSLFEA